MPGGLHNRLQQFGQIANELLLEVPVFIKVMGIALGMVLMLSAGIFWQIHQSWHGLLLTEFQRRGQVHVIAVAGRCEAMVQAGRFSEVETELRNSLSESPEVASLILQDTRGTTLAQVHSPTFSPSAALIEVNIPLDNGKYQWRAALSRMRVDQEIGWLIRRLGRTTALVAILGLMVAWWLTRLIARPITELVEAIHKVKSGNYHVKAVVRARDEVGLLASAFNEMTHTLAEKESARQQLLRRVIHVGEEERKRVARELHDHTGQSLTSLIANLGALESQSQDLAMSERLAALRKQVEESLGEIHNLSVALRPSVLDDVGLIAALQRHCSRFGQRAGIEVRFSQDGCDGHRFSTEVELAFYRMVQEALTNTIRHGKASRVRVFVQRTATGVLASVRDNGRGFDGRNWQKKCLESQRLGLLGIEERMTLLGGSFCIESEPGKGTTAYAEIPLNSCL